MPLRSRSQNTGGTGLPEGTSAFFSGSSFYAVAGEHDYRSDRQPRCV